MGGFPPYGASPPSATILPVAVFDIATPLADCTALSESNSESHLKRKGSSPYLVVDARTEILNKV